MIIQSGKYAAEVGKINKESKKFGGN